MAGSMSGHGIGPRGPWLQWRSVAAFNASSKFRGHRKAAKKCPCSSPACCTPMKSFTPRHASWLNQIEIYFSIVQQKVLTPNDFASLAALEHYLLALSSALSGDRDAVPLDLQTRGFASAVGAACCR